MIHANPPDLFSQLANKAHPHCFVCSLRNPQGLQVRFQRAADGGIEGVFACQREFEGYAGLIHGGVISSLLDGAMTHCLLAEGHQALTGDLRVRFRQPVIVGREAVIHAEIVKTFGPLYVVQSTLTQDGSVKAQATGKFADPKRNILPHAAKGD